MKLVNRILLRERFIELDFTAYLDLQPLDTISKSFSHVAS